MKKNIRLLCLFFLIQSCSKASEGELTNAQQAGLPLRVLPPFGTRPEYDTKIQITLDSREAFLGRIGAVFKYFNFEKLGCFENLGSKTVTESQVADAVDKALAQHWEYEERQKRWLSQELNQTNDQLLRTPDIVSLITHGKLCRRKI